MFIVDLFYGLIGVFLFGGFYVIIKKFLEYYDDRLLDNKIGGWLGKQDYMFVQLFPPSENTRSLSEMEAFFVNLHSIFSSKSKKDIYISGKWYDTFTFEVHSRSGQVGFFCRLNRSHLALFRSSITAHYPGTGIVETPDPLISWPKEWTGGFGEYKYYFGTDIEVAGKEHFPIKSWTEFQSGSQAPLNDPINVLINSMEDIENNEYLVLQFVLTPFSDSNRIKTWKGDLAKLKKEYSTNAQVETTEGGQVQVLTKQERNIIDAVEAKINGTHFKTKIRVLFLSGSPAPQRLLSRVMNYFKEFQTENQFFKPSKLTKTNIEDDGDRFGFIGPTLGVILDKLYWSKEQKYRMQIMYKATLGRSSSKGIPPTFMTADNLASMIHFPTTYESLSSQITKKTSIEYEGGSSIIQAGSPPPNLPT